MKANGKEPHLTQRVFADLLRTAQAAYGLSNDQLSARTGIDATTISRYRSPSYKSGPPSEGKRLLLERAIGLPEGYFKGLVRMSVEEMRSRIADGRMATYVAESRKIRDTIYGPRPKKEPEGEVAPRSRVSLDEPSPERALEILELRMRLAVAEGRMVSREEQLEWLDLAQRARGDADRGEARG